MKTSADDICDEKDIASWPQYNVSQIAEGKWPEAVELCKEMLRQWLTDANLSQAFLVDAGKAFHSQRVRTVMASFNWEGEPRITVFDPDKKNSRNYAD